MPWCERILRAVGALFFFFFFCFVFFFFPFPPAVFFLQVWDVFTPSRSFAQPVAVLCYVCPPAPHFFFFLLFSTNLGFPRARAKGVCVKRGWRGSWCGGGGVSFFFFPLDLI